MSHTYFQNVMHIAFSTKERWKIIPTEMKERLWAYTAGICQHQNILVHAIRGMDDHIHRHAVGRCVAPPALDCFFYLFPALTCPSTPKTGVPGTRIALGLLLDAPPALG